MERIHGCTPLAPSLSIYVPDLTALTVISTTLSPVTSLTTTISRLLGDTTENKAVSALQENITSLPEKAKQREWKSLPKKQQKKQKITKQWTSFLKLFLHS